MKQLGMLLPVLSLTGLNVFQESESKGLCYMLSIVRKSIFPTLMFSCMSLIIYGVIHNDRIMYERILSTCVTVLPSIMWMTMFKKRSSLRNLLMHMDKDTRIASKPDTLRPWVINIFLLLGILYPTLMKTLAWYSTGELTKLNYWEMSLGYCIKLHETVFPSILAISYCVLCCILLRRLQVGHDQLRQLMSSPDNHKTKYLVGYYLDVVAGIDHFQEVFSSSVFLLMWQIFCILSYSLMEALTDQKDWLESLVLDTVLYILYGCGVIGVVTIFAAEVPLEMQRVKSTLLNLQFQRMMEGEMVFDEKYVEMLLKMDVTVLTACNVFPFDRGFLLKALGALLAQVLVFYQIINNSK